MDELDELCKTLFCHQFVLLAVYMPHSVSYPFIPASFLKVQIGVSNLSFIPASFLKVQIGVSNL